MAEPIIFISRFRILEGQEPTFESAYAQAVELIGSTKPRTALFAAYLQLGTEARIVHAFPDGQAMIDHFEGSEGRSHAVEDVMELRGFELYGQVPAEALAQLQREAATAGVGVETFAHAIGGFLRAPD